MSDFCHYDYVRCRNARGETNTSTPNLLRSTLPWLNCDDGRNAPAFKNGVFSGIGPSSQVRLCAAFLSHHRIANDNPGRPCL